MTLVLSAGLDQLKSQKAVQLSPVNIADLLRRPARKLDRDRMRQWIQGRRILVTGAGGSIGIELARQVGELGPEKLKPAPLLTGHDLIAEGYRPGPAFSDMLSAVEDAQLESQVGTREEALELVHRLFPRPEE